jgi:exodeoxyribonuclease VII small subunit
LVTKKKSEQTSANDVPADFEQALAELEQIVASMERGDLTLEASMAAYARGVVLAKACQSQLQAAEQQVRVLEQDLLKPLQNGTNEQD